jgi:hypothetical protein
MMLTKVKAATGQDVTGVMLRGTRRRMWDCLRREVDAWSKEKAPTVVVTSMTWWR